MKGMKPVQSSGGRYMIDEARSGNFYRVFVVGEYFGAGSFSTAEPCLYGSSRYASTKTHHENAPVPPAGAYKLRI